jgi:hypothetical protein
MLPQIIAVSSAGMIHPTFTVESSLIADPDLLIDSYEAELRNLGGALHIRGDPIFSKSVEECLPVVKSSKLVKVSSQDKNLVFDAMWSM